MFTTKTQGISSNLFVLKFSGKSFVLKSMCHENYQLAFKCHQLRSAGKMHSTWFWNNADRGPTRHKIIKNHKIFKFWSKKKIGIKYKKIIKNHKTFIWKNFIIGLSFLTVLYGLYITRKVYHALPIDFWSYTFYSVLILFDFKYFLNFNQ